MKDQRKLELFRSIVKDLLRKKGIKLDQVITLKEIQQEVKDFNKQNKLSTPVTVAEFYEIYSEIMKELVAEYFVESDKIIATIHKKG